MKGAVLYDDIAYFDVDFLQLAVFAGVGSFPLAADHDHDVDAVGSVHPAAR